MKKIIVLVTLIAVTLSSCLKDSPTTVNFKNAGNFVNFPLGGLASFSNDAITADIDTIQFAVDYATVNPNPAISATIAVDQTLTTKYNAANTAINYLPMPTSVYSLSATTINIPAGQQYSFVTLIVNKAALDPTQSYMLPIKIASTTGAAISSNLSVHYFHVIGNDFAGAYLSDFTRVPAGGNYTGRAVTFLPDSPTQFEVVGGYFTQDIRYVVSFTKTGIGASAAYTNFAISINSDDVTRIATSGIAVTTAPKILGYTSGQSYTFAQSLALFKTGFQYGVTGGSGSRVNTDTYYKP